MKVFLTGATGAVGPATVRGLLDRGHDVRAVARSDEKAATVRALGADPVAVDLFDADDVKRAVEGSDAILHLATNVPPVNRMNRKSAWATHNGLRTTASEHLVDAALATGVSTFVKESVSFVYPDGGDAWVDETTPPADDVPMLLPTLAGERVADRFAAGGGRAVVLRFAGFYGPSARYVDEALRMARLRMALMSGKGYVSAIHTADVASAAVAALDVPGGIYNVADDEPLTKREYVDAFSAAFGLHKLRIPPAWTARLATGSSSKAVTRSWRISNRKLKAASDWAPKVPNARIGWAAIAAERQGAVAAASPTASAGAGARDGDQEEGR
jgi:nucleoside-diphosphate-sugar epimerase